MEGLSTASMGSNCCRRVGNHLNCTSRDNELAGIDDMQVSTCNSRSHVRSISTSVSLVLLPTGEIGTANGHLPLWLGSRKCLWWCSCIRNLASKRCYCSVENTLLGGGYAFPHFLKSRLIITNATGLPTIVFAVIVWFWLPDNPAKAKFLSERDREIAIELSLRQPGDRENDEFQWRQAVGALLDYRSYLPPLIYFGCNVCFGS